VLFQHPEFREWFEATYRQKLDLHPELRLSDCEGCGSTGVPVLVDHCLTCVASDYGMSLGEKRIADALRTFVRILVNDPPDAAQRVVSQVMFSLADATRRITEHPAPADEPEDDDEK